MVQEKEATPVAAVPADKRTENPVKVKPTEGVTDLVNSDRKENLKRTSEEERPSVSKLKKPKDSLEEPALMSDKKSRHTWSSGFKIH